MHINTESKGYKVFRDCLNWASFTGGCVTLDCVTIPFIQAMFDKQFKFLRPIGYLGALGLSMISGYAAANAIDDHATAVVDLINIKDAEKNAKKDADISDWFNEPETTAKKQYLGIDIPGKNATPAEEKEFVDKLIAKQCPFKFDSLETAQDAVEKVMDELSQNGFYSLSDYYKTVGKVELPKSVIDICLMYGWVLADFKEDDRHTRINVDKMSRSFYIVDLFGYHDISDKYVTYEED